MKAARVRSSRDQVGLGEEVAPGGVLGASGLAGLGEGETAGAAEGVDAALGEGLAVAGARVPLGEVEGTDVGVPVCAGIAVGAHPAKTIATAQSANRMRPILRDRLAVRNPLIHPGPPPLEQHEERRIHIHVLDDPHGSVTPI